MLLAKAHLIWMPSGQADHARPCVQALVVPPSVLAGAASAEYIWKALLLELPIHWRELPSLTDLDEIASGVLLGADSHRANNRYYFAVVESTEGH
jgi:hypothetical protein